MKVLVDVKRIEGGVKSTVSGTETEAALGFCHQWSHRRVRDGVQAVEMIERERPDLVLLDIQMPGLDGFGVIEALADPPPVIFVTAYDEYAIRAFEVNALDYLLKPFSRERLEQAVYRAQEEVAEEQDSAVRLVPLLESLAAQGCYLTRLAVRDRDHISVLSTTRRSAAEL